MIDIYSIYIYFQIPEEWISDDRCLLCKYSKKSFPRLCHCRQNLDNTNKYYEARKNGIRNPCNEESQGPPIPPVRRSSSRTNSLTRGKKKKVLILELSYVSKIVINRNCCLKIFSKIIVKNIFQASNGSYYNDYSLPNRHMRHSRSREQNG